MIIKNITGCRSVSEWLCIGLRNLLRYNPWKKELDDKLQQVFEGSLLVTA